MVDQRPTGVNAHEVAEANGHHRVAEILLEVKRTQDLQRGRARGAHLFASASSAGAGAGAGASGAPQSFNWGRQ